MGVTRLDPSMYPRIDIDEEAQRAYLWLWGNRYEIRTVEANADHAQPHWIYDDVLQPYFNPVCKIEFGVRLAPIPPPPPPPRRRWSTTMGLRRPAA